MPNTQDTPKPYLLKSGAPAHIFTPEDRARSVANRRAKADARRKSLMDCIAEENLKHAQGIVGVWLKGILEQGDWKAAQAWIERCEGRPTQRTELETVTKAAEDMSLSELRAALYARLEGTEG